jgi:hypothetical protein
MDGPRAALLCKSCGSLRMGLEPSFDGELRRRDGAELPTGVREVRITRLQSRGPFFDIDGVGFFGDPTLTAIRQSGPRNTRVRSPLTPCILRTSTGTPRLVLASATRIVHRGELSHVAVQPSVGVRLRRSSGTVFIGVPWGSRNAEPNTALHETVERFRCTASEDALVSRIDQMAKSRRTITAPIPTYQKNRGQKILSRLGRLAGGLGSSGLFSSGGLP